MTDYAERFPELLDECHDLVQEVSPDGTIRRVNRAWRDTLGYDESELHRLNLFDILHPACKDHCRTQFGRVLLGGAIKDVEATLVAKDGQAIAVLGSCRCLFSSDQQATSCFGVFHDITHRKKVEDELKQREAELEERVRDRTEAVTKMNEALKHASWLADNERWQAEHRVALETLKEVEQCLLEHSEALEDHTRAARAHDEAMAAHERAMRDYEQLGEHSSFQESLTGSHQTFADRHDNQRQAHERIRQHHEKVIAGIAALKKAIEEAV